MRNYAIALIDTPAGKMIILDEMEMLETGDKVLKSDLTLEEAKRQLPTYSKQLGIKINPLYAI